MAMADKIPDPTDKYVGSRVGRELINALGQTTYQGLFAPKSDLQRPGRAVGKFGQVRYALKAELTPSKDRNGAYFLSEACPHQMLPQPWIAENGQRKEEPTRLLFRSTHEFFRN